VAPTYLHRKGRPPSVPTFFTGGEKERRRAGGLLRRRREEWIISRRRPLPFIERRGKEFQFSKVGGKILGEEKVFISS